MHLTHTQITNTLHQLEHNQLKQQIINQITHDAHLPPPYIQPDPFFKHKPTWRISRVTTDTSHLTGLPTYSSDYTQYTYQDYLHILIYPDLTLKISINNPKTNVPDKTPNDPTHQITYTLKNWPQPTTIEPGDPNYLQKATTTIKHLTETQEKFEQTILKYANIIRNHLPITTKYT